VPRGGWAEDLAVAPGVLERYPGFQATASSDPAVRTARNVADADATLVLVLSDTASPGTALTLRCAEALGVPCVIVELMSPERHERIRAFLVTLASRSTLNVAGPRESEQPGVYDAASSFLEAYHEELFAP
jgi:Circularly permutated YpsA SLOG family